MAGVGRLPYSALSANIIKKKEYTFFSLQKLVVAFEGAKIFAKNCAIMGRQIFGTFSIP